MINYITHYLKGLNFNNKEVCMSGKILFSLISIVFVLAATALEFGLYSLMRLINDVYFHWLVILIMCAIPIGLFTSLFMLFDIMRSLWTSHKELFK